MVIKPLSPLQRYLLPLIGYSLAAVPLGILWLCFRYQHYHGAGVIGVMFGIPGAIAAYQFLGREAFDWTETAKITYLGFSLGVIGGGVFGLFV